MWVFFWFIFSSVSTIPVLFCVSNSLHWLSWKLSCIFIILKLQYLVGMMHKVPVFYACKFYTYSILLAKREWDALEFCKVMQAYNDRKSTIFIRFWILLNLYFGFPITFSQEFSILVLWNLLIHIFPGATNQKDHLSYHS